MGRSSAWFPSLKSRDNGYVSETLWGESVREGVGSCLGLVGRAITLLSGLTVVSFSLCGAAAETVGSAIAIVGSQAFPPHREVGAESKQVALQLECRKCRAVGCGASELRMGERDAKKWTMGRMGSQPRAGGGEEGSGGSHRE